MRKNNKNIDIHVKPLCYISLAVALFIVPVQWLFSWYVALLLHELFHYCAVRICGRRVYYIQFGLHGAIMNTEELSDRQWLFCALAGPFAGILLLFTAKWFPRLAICGLVQSLYNLLPIYPLDGGRALQGFLSGVLKLQNGERISRYIGNAVFFILLILALYAVIHLKLGLLPIVFVYLLYLKNRKIKTTCKPSPEGVK
jgi:membrane-associated protease RseP (regulator of RpoE activity)